MAEVRIARHLGFYISAASGAVIGFAALAFVPALAVMIGVNVFFVAYLGFTGLALRRLTADFLRRHAEDEDAPAPLLFLVMIGAVVVSAVSLLLVLAGPTMPVGPLALGIASVVLGWFAIHTMWAMHYAYEFYAVPEASADKGGAPNEGGLSFPGDDEPDGTAFLYFAYAVGMTAQTSDTGITSNHMRRLVTIHSVFSFFFNTVLVAAAVNIVVSLAN